MTGGAGAEARTVPLAHGRTLTVRAATRQDAPGLGLLFDSLSDEDRYHRFLALYRPQPDFLERWVTIADAGGCALVAVVDDGEPGVQLVGEAGYSILPNGDGDFGITVGPGWRGWLGPYLLNALFEEAAARGVPNLESTVLFENRAMLRLARSRGYATVAEDDVAAVHVILSTTGRTPGWPPLDHRPRVLVEVPGLRWRPAVEARRAGLEVIICRGPGPSPGPTTCPVLRGERCPLADGADAIVVALPASDPRTQQLLASHRERHGAAVVEDGLARTDPEGPAVMEVLSWLLLGDAARGDGPSPA